MDRKAATGIVVAVLASSLALALLFVVMALAPDRTKPQGTGSQSGNDFVDAPHPEFDMFGNPWGCEEARHVAEDYMSQNFESNNDEQWWDHKEGSGGGYAYNLRSDGAFVFYFNVYEYLGSRTSVVGTWAITVKDNQVIDIER